MNNIMDNTMLSAIEFAQQENMIKIYMVTKNMFLMLMY